MKTKSTNSDTLYHLAIRATDKLFNLFDYITIFHCREPWGTFLIASSAKHPYSNEDEPPELNCSRLQSPSMAGTQSYVDDLSGTLDERLIISSTPQRSNALSNKFSGVLSASYADSEIRDALHSLDENEIKNTAETRRRLRLNVQKQVIQRNGAVVQEYGHVAEVRLVQRIECLC